MLRRMRSRRPFFHDSAITSELRRLWRIHEKAQFKLQRFLCFSERLDS